MFKRPKSKTTALKKKKSAKSMFSKYVSLSQTRFHWELNSNRWIQSPECWPLHHGTNKTMLSARSRIRFSCSPHWTILQACWSVWRLNGTTGMALTLNQKLSFYFSLMSNREKLMWWCRALKPQPHTEILKKYLLTRDVVYFCIFLATNGFRSSY